MRNTDKPNRLKATLIAAAIAVLPLATHAAGLGKITVLSALGQPLKAELEVTATREEATSLLARVATVEAFRQAGLDYSPALATLRFSRDIKERNGRRYLEISTDRPLNEPFIDMLVELTWASGRLVREYTFLLDPPDLAAKVAPVPVAAPEVRDTARVKPAEVPPAAAAESRPVLDSRPSEAVQPAAKPAGDNMRTVVAGDTLGKIAAQTRHEGVSLDQMLVALFRANRDVFDAGNMNRLKAGKILSIPDAETARSVAPAEARREIIAQSADFNAYRQRLAAAAAASEPADKTAKQAVSGKITPRVEDRAPVATGKDKLEVSRTEAARDAKGKPLQGRITALEEDLVARERALKEASSRIVELERNLGDLQKLAAIKSQAGADLQKAAAAPAAKPAEPPKPVEAAKPAEAPKPTEPPKPADAAKPGDPAPAKPVEAPKPADAAAAKPADVPKPPPAKKVVPPPPPEPEPDFIEENAPLVFGGGALLAALFAWLGISAYRKKRAASAAALAPLPDTDFSAHSVFSTTSIAPPPSEQETSQFSTTGMGMAAGQETVDPVVEADTFLAFGRDAQAEEILLEALKTDSQRQAIHMKLLDIYAARKDVTRFEEVAQDLFALTGGTGETWNKVAAMGLAIAPESTLYAGAASAAPSAPAVDLEATASLHPTPALNLDATQIVSAVPVAPAESPALDFDLDIGTPPATGAGSAPAAATESAALDFDLDLGAPATASASAVGPAPKSDDVVLDIDFDMPAKQPESAGLDFPMGVGTPAPAAEAPAPALAVPAAAADSGGIDFDFDLGSDAKPAPLPEMTVEVSMPPAAPEPAPLNLGGISLELDTPAGAAPAAAEVADKPEVATKLELAAAYAEMGDNDGARELLQEALAEGSPSQQEAARTKLASLG